MEQVLRISANEEDLVGAEILEINVRVGDKFAEGDYLCIVGKDGDMEENALQAPCSGQVVSISTRVGNIIVIGMPLFVIETDLGDKKS